MVCPFVPFILAIVLSVLQFIDSDYPFGIFKLSLGLLMEDTGVTRKSYWIT